MNRPDVRHDWTRAEVDALFDLPLPTLVFQAMNIHRAVFDAEEVQLSQLLSIKTGGCAEDCGYCSQSSHFDTGLKASKLMEADAVIALVSNLSARSRKRIEFKPSWFDVNSDDAGNR